MSATLQRSVRFREALFHDRDPRWTNIRYVRVAVIEDRSREGPLADLRARMSS
jgi:hypothetical protein